MPNLDTKDSVQAPENKTNVISADVVASLSPPKELIAENVTQLESRCGFTQRNNPQNEGNINYTI